MREKNRIIMFYYLLDSTFESAPFAGFIVPHPHLLVVVHHVPVPPADNSKHLDLHSHLLTQIRLDFRFLKPSDPELHFQNWWDPGNMLIRIRQLKLKTK